MSAKVWIRSTFSVNTNHLCIFFLRRKANKTNFRAHLEIEVIRNQLFNWQQLIFHLIYSLFALKGLKSRERLKLNSLERHASSHIDMTAMIVFNTSFPSSALDLTCDQAFSLFFSSRREKERLIAGYIGLATVKTPPVAEFSFFRVNHHYDSVISLKSQVKWRYESCREDTLESRYFNELFALPRVSYYYFFNYSEPPRSIT